MMSGAPKLPIFTVLPSPNITPAMTSNLLQGVLKLSAHERLDALVHDKDDDSDDELVNVVRSPVFLLGYSSPKDV